MTVFIWYASITCMLTQCSSLLSFLLFCADLIVFHNHHIEKMCACEQYGTHRLTCDAKHLWYYLLCLLFFHFLFRKLKRHVQSRILMDEEKIRKQLTQSSLVNILLLFFNFWSAKQTGCFRKSKCHKIMWPDLWRQAVLAQTTPYNITGINSGTNYLYSVTCNRYDLACDEGFIAFPNCRVWLIITPNVFNISLSYYDKPWCFVRGIREPNFRVIPH